MIGTRTILLTLTVLFASFALCAGQGKPYGVSVVATPHNLSVSGGGGAHDVKSNVQGEICIFCHTPHHATQTPLWSRDVPSTTVYKPYVSTTLKSPTKPDQPQRGSRLCLSCHDGTIALGAIGPKALGYNLDSSLPTMPVDVDPKKNARLGTDLSDDHPISFPYPSSAVNPELIDPSALTDPIKLTEGVYLECNTCHDPHNNQYGNFLVLDVSVNHDALCVKCHSNAGWNDFDAVHRTGGTRYTLGSPSTKDLVQANGCMNCHLVHSAQKGEHLLKLSQAGSGEETNCYVSCHNASPYVSIWNQFTNLTYTHPITAAVGVHKEDEALPLAGTSKHVECVDCHNPHQTGMQGSPLGAKTPLVPPASVAPYVNGPLRGVRGVDETGKVALAEASFEFQICYKCHAGGSSDRFTSLSYPPPQRAFSTYDESLRFSSTNPSSHPVTADRLGTGRSLLSAYQTRMLRIYCSDCHSPHGSNEPHILAAQNWDTYPSVTTSYPLCFTCHDSGFLLNPLISPHAGSAALHKSHLLDHANKASCSACHDPHGVPSALGATSTSGAHLVNFDTRYTGPNPVYQSNTQSCTVNGTCHTIAAPTQSYTLN